MTGSRPVEVLMKRMARRDVEVSILEEMAEQRLLENDPDGFRRLGDRAWRIKVRNLRVGFWLMRRHCDAIRNALEGGAL